MIAADTSAVMAILLDEDDGPAFHSAMRKDGEVLVSTATALELLTVAMGRGDAIYQSAVAFLARPFIRLVPLDEAQLWAAADACRRYGKGRHPARLNYGDTFAYALASTRGVPLLFKGDDFARTDLTPAAL